MGLEHVGTGALVVGGLAGVGIGGYNIGHGEHAQFGAAEERAELDSQFATLPEGMRERVADDLAVYKQETEARPDAWRNAGIALGVSGLATVGLGVASLFTRGTTASTLRIAGALAGVATAGAGLATWKQYDDYRSTEPADRLIAGIEDAVVDAAAEQLGNGPLVREVHTDGAVTAAPTGAMPVSVPGGPDQGEHPASRHLAAQYQAAGLETTYSVKEYATTLDTLLDVSPGTKELLLADMAQASGSEARTTGSVARALDDDGNGTLTGSERQDVWPMVSLAQYAGMRAQLGESGPEAIATMGMMYEAIAAGDADLLGGFTQEEAMRSVGSQFALAEDIGLLPSDGAPVDWIAVAGRADALLARETPAPIVRSGD